MMETLLQKSRNLPDKPGVYLFHGDKNQILYIGKAKFLKKRVMSYFKKSHDTRPQLPKLISLISDIRFIVTSSEREAIILESNLIKQNQPDFNICLKDDKYFQSIKFHTEEEFPKISIVRKYEREKNNIYFGPYCESKDVKTAYKNIIEYFQIRDCTETEFAHRQKINKPCLKYQMQICSGSCANRISKEEYLKSFNNAIDFMEGKNKLILEKLKEKIDLFSNRLEFENANEAYKKYLSLKNILEAESNVSGYLEDSDVIGYNYNEDKIIFQILIIRKGRIISGDVKSFQNNYLAPGEFLRMFIEQYYLKSMFIPNNLIVRIKPDDKALLEDILSEKSGLKVKIIVPKRGLKLNVLLMAEDNAKIKTKEIVAQNLKQSDFNSGLKKIFNSAKEINYIECYDISHLSGKDIVGAKVVFKNLKPFKAGYRYYNINTVTESDDYKSLYEILERRIKRGIEEKDIPDLIVVDGGLGQLAVLEKVLSENNIKIFSMAISKETHAKNSNDKIYIGGRKNPLNLKNNDIVYLKIKEIRDEVHRFVIKFHRQKRDKRIFGE